MASRDCDDVAIVGVGPAGLQAAVHAGRRKAAVMKYIRTNKQQLTDIAGIEAAGDIGGMPR